VSRTLFAGAPQQRRLRLLLFVFHLPPSPKPPTPPTPPQPPTYPNTSHAQDPSATVWVPVHSHPTTTAATTPGSTSPAAATATTHQGGESSVQNGWSLKGYKQHTPLTPSSSSESRNVYRDQLKAMQVIRSTINRSLSSFKEKLTVAHVERLLRSRRGSDSVTVSS
jgi:hypothetical protein